METGVVVGKVELGVLKWYGHEERMGEERKVNKNVCTEANGVRLIWKA